MQESERAFVKANASPDPCRLCGNDEGNRTFRAREMMLGTRAAFDYRECRDCGTLQIARIPDDLGPYYAGEYYAFDVPYTAPPVRRWLKRRLARHALGRRDPVGRLLASVRGVPQEMRWVRRAGLGLDASILDVGTGAGQTLLTMRDYGFRRLLGVDPFLDRDRDYGGGLVVRRGTVEEVEGRFDLVMFHHSLEHARDPERELRGARGLLAPGGTVLVRMPVVGESWEVYGPDWVELDPPRHLHVFTLEGVRRLAARAGLRLVDTAFDTTAFEVWGSEQYRRDIPLNDVRSHGFGGSGSVFDDAELSSFEARADALNRSGRAGRAAFWLAAAES